MSGRSTRRRKLEKRDAVAGQRTLCIAIDETGNEDFKSELAIFGIAGVFGFGPEMVRAERPAQNEGTFIRRDV